MYENSVAYFQFFQWSQVSRLRSLWSRCYSLLNIGRRLPRSVLDKERVFFCSRLVLRTRTPSKRFSTPFDPENKESFAEQKVLLQSRVSQRIRLRAQNSRQLLRSVFDRPPAGESRTKLNRFFLRTHSSRLSRNFFSKSLDFFRETHSHRIEPDRGYLVPLPIPCAIPRG